MRFLFVLVFALLLYADDYERKLYDKVLPLIFQHKPLVVYVDDEVKDLLQKSTTFKLVSQCSDDVEVLIGKNFQNLPFSCLKKPIFTTSYRFFKKNENSFGAFYWRKGRPQLKLKKDVLEKFGLKLPPNLRKYAK